MAERESKRQLYVTSAAVIAVVLLLCALGAMRLISEWVVLGALAAGAVIIVYTVRLREKAQENQALSDALAHEREQNQRLEKQLAQERESAARQLEAERADGRRRLLELEAANEEKNAALLSSLSHELRLPVSVAAGYADLLLDHAIEDEQEAQEYLSKIADRLRYLNEIVSRNLSAMKGEEGNAAAHLQKMVFDLAAFIRSELEDCRAMAQEKGIDIQFISPESAVQVSADPVLLRHIIDNLLENAMKYMKRPGTVSFVLTRRGTEVELVCRDDGLGMESDQAVHIFENGYRGSNTGSLSGSGHGLHMVNIIAQAHGGSCTAESSPGSGMRISLRLPIGLQPQPAETGEAQPVAAFAPESGQAQLFEERQVPAAAERAAG